MRNLKREIEDLKMEIVELKKMVNMLLEMVTEDEGFDEVKSLDMDDEFSMYM